MYFLDKETPMEQFRIVVSTEPYVDKSMLINKIYPLIGKENRFMCITRPRRFGKTINAVMLGAYYTKGYDTHELFKDLKIAQTVSYEEHINKHHVIYIDFSRLPDPCNSYEEYISWIKYCLQDDLKKGYGIEKVPGEPIQNLFEKTNEKFIFIMDEWDSIFYKDFMQEKDKKAYLEFLKGLFKTQPYVELAYMTGVLPIAKYSTGSELNMFDELNFMNDDEYDLFFGFHEDEVKELCNQMNSVGYEELKYWYDGYYTSEGKSLFNPRSVSLALQKGKCKNYWTETGPMNEIAEYIEHNVDEVREDIVKMVAGIPVEVELEGYAASQLQLDSRDEILSAMVVFGFLSYHDGFLRIPNHELMEKFQRVLKRKSMGSVADIVNNSKNVLDATIALDGQKVAQYIEEAHDREIPFLQYNNENSLSCVITLCYLYARNYYDVTREDKSGKGYVDYLFTPKKKGYPAIILELKYNKCAEEAIDQIKKKNYVERVKDFDEILFVGINYSTDADKHKHHDCIIEKYK
ncbi:MULTISPECIES: AAA family ATPase [Erysipelotrichaceae]|uniref:AAA family ATPase n=12 Tax=Bacillota TaxID=1239 RepID=A0A7G9GQ87_9FIRM|nr:MULTISPECIES: AAA family ATPase [Erysipelotrichaceae]QNM12969.1 AAA family ATPase [[Eubacterium] hominis]MCH4287080.1 ATP-binding protein [Amedibacillus hominis]RGB49197.1 AAA family ATPase [Absiella sp. AM22-9]RGB72467.1 AAA family ATPase [Absiella sp. AM09-50]RGC23765.1 AAA family ATPase [Absiella sp. AM54-8XD]